MIGGIVPLLVDVGVASETDLFVDEAAEYKMFDVILKRVETQDLEAESAHLPLNFLRLSPIID